MPDDDELPGAGADIDPGDFCVKYRADWLSYAVSLAKNWPDAEDAVQRAALKILKHHAVHGTLCPGGYDPVAYSKKMIANYIKDLHRRSRSQRKRLPSLLPPPEEATEDVLDRILGKAALAFMESLKPRAHVIAVMRWVDALEPKEIAEQLGLNVCTVRTSLHRTSKKMRAHLGITAEPGRVLREETP